MKNEKVKNSGITLIALIITIIVLLILAGISINAVVGDNGILMRAIEAAEKTTVSEEKEQIEIAYVSVIAKNENVGESELQGELDTNVGENKTEVTENPDGTFLVLYNDTDHYYEVDDGVVTEIDAETMASRNYYIKNSAGATYYSTLADAYAGAESGETIYVYRNNSDDSELTVTSDKEITIDLNGKTVTRSVTTTVSSSGVLTITDTSEGGEGVYTTGENEVNTVYVYAGTFNLYAGIVESDYDGSSVASIWYVSGKVCIYGGYVKGGYFGLYASSGYYWIYIYGGTVSAKYAFAAYGCGSSGSSCGLFMYGGTLSGGNVGLFLGRSSSYYSFAYIYGGKIEGGSSGIYHKTGSATVTLYDCYVIGNYGVYWAGNGTLNLGLINVGDEGPAITGGVYGVYYSTGTVGFYKGIVKGKIAAFNADPKLKSGYTLVSGTEEIDGVTYYTAYLEESE